MRLYTTSRYLFIAHGVCTLLNSTFSQQHPDLPVLGSLLAGLLLPVHGNDSAPDNGDDADNATSSQTTTMTSSVTRSTGQQWTPPPPAHIVHGLRATAGVAEICDRLKELDQISKCHVDILEHFVVRSQHGF